MIDSKSRLYLLFKPILNASETRVELNGKHSTDLGFTQPVTATKHRHINNGLSTVLVLCCPLLEQKYTSDDLSGRLMQRNVFSFGCMKHIGSCNNADTRRREEESMLSKWITDNFKMLIICSSSISPSWQVFQPNDSRNPNWWMISRHVFRLSRGWTWMSYS